MTRESHLTTLESTKRFSLLPQYFANRHLEQAWKDLEKFDLLSRLRIQPDSPNNRVFYFLLARNMMKRTHETLRARYTARFTLFHYTPEVVEEMLSVVQDAKESIGIIQSRLSLSPVTLTDTIGRVVGAVEDLSRFGLTTPTYKFLDTFGRIPSINWTTRVELSNKELASWAQRWQRQDKK